ncbi:MAG: hypothetical protein ACRDKX_01915 [Solirubrobacterales bacterium]
MSNGMTFPRRGVGLPPLLLLIIAVFAGCGGSDSGDGSTGGGSTPTKDSDPKAGRSAQQAPTPGPPEAVESIQDAQERFAEAISSGDCDQIGEIAYGGADVPQEVIDARCEQYKTRFKNAEAQDVERFGAGGGVIDYSDPAGGFSTVLVLDQEGLYHVLFIDPFLGGKSVGTEPTEEWDEAVDEAVHALRDRDCAALLAVASDRFGPGAHDKSAACGFVDKNPIAAAFDADPKAKLEGLGANGDYAFYGLSGPNAYYVLVMARQSDEDKPPKAEPLPKDPPEYAFARVVRTNTTSAAQ